MRRLRFGAVINQRAWGSWQLAKIILVQPLWGELLGDLEKKFAEGGALMRISLLYLFLLLV